jgi:DNA-binding MarR family transcriptional regulator
VTCKEKWEESLNLNNIIFTSLYLLHQPLSPIPQNNALFLSQLSIDDLAIENIFVCTSKVSIMKEHTSDKCLYAASISFARQMSKLAEECFAPTGMNPSQAFLLMTVIEEPGINPKKASDILGLAPSTITRFADTLEQKGYIERDKYGKNSAIYPTKFGKQALGKITESISMLYEIFSKKIGESEAKILATQLTKAAEKLK